MPKRCSPRPGLPRRRRRAGRLPELTLSGYSIDDILMQDTLVESVGTRWARSWPPLADLLPVLVVGAPLRHRNRLYNTAVVIHRGTVPRGGAPSRICRPTASSTNAARWRPATTCAARSRCAARRCRSVRPVVPGLPICRGSCCTWRSVRTWGAGAAERTARRWPARRSWPTCPAARSPWAAPRTASCWPGSASSRCLAAYVSCRRRRRGVSTDLAWDGQTMIYENGLLLAESSVSQGAAAQRRRRRHRAAAGRAAADGNVRRQPSHPGDRDGVRHVQFTLDPPDADIGLRRNVERFPFVPSDPARLQQDCASPTASRSPDSEQRLRAAPSKVVIGVSGGWTPRMR